MGCAAVSIIYMSQRCLYAIGVCIHTHAYYGYVTLENIYIL
jgi:hypothetical protein